MIRRPPRSTRTDPPFPYPTLFRSLSSDLGFAPADRAENIRRVGEVAALFARAGVLVITAFISPYREDRDRARAVAPELFHEVYVKADLEVCETRDPKGLYKKARTGEISAFTGIRSEERRVGTECVCTCHSRW